MRLVRVHGVDRLSVDDVEVPSTGPNDVVLRIAACGICGSDLGCARYGMLRRGNQPFPLGHEAAGTIEAVGSNVEGITPGMRVLLNPAGSMDNVIGNGGSEGAFCDLLLVRNAKLGEHLLPIPDTMPMT